MSTTSEKSTTYFGFGSNLWKDQMKLRCPTSKYLGIARLNGYKWIINDRGYANVVEVTDEKKAADYEVWGLVYSLQTDDEESLDRNEGVPFAYTKESVTVDFWAKGDDKTCNVKVEPKQTKMLVYIDRKRTKPDKPKKEYIYRMNMGIKDALKEGVPKIYIDNALRPFIPDDEDKAMESFAKQQALLFEDET